MQVAGLLAAEGPLQTLREWQSALGRAASLLPPWPLGPIHLEHDPGLTDAEFSELLPDDVRDAWTSAMSPTQVEFTHIRDGFKPSYAGAAVTVDPSSARWWTLPVHQRDGRGVPVLHTTRGPWLGAPSVEAFGHEDASFESPWSANPAPAGTSLADEAGRFGLRWRDLDIRLPQPRVFEVASSRDWVALTNAFPHRTLTHQHRGARRRSTAIWPQWFPTDWDFVEPDWAAVAVKYDAIHLTQLAYATSAYSPHRCDHGYTTITGWSPDQTRWLADPREPRTEPSWGK